MTCCVAIKPNAGLDQIIILREVLAYERADDRFTALPSAGNVNVRANCRSSPSWTGAAKTSWNHARVVPAN